METIASLAAEFNAQPHEVASFADLGNIAQDAPLDAETVEMIREAWAQAPEVEMRADQQADAEVRLFAAIQDVFETSGWE